MDRVELWNVIYDCVQRIYDPAVLKAKAKQTLKATGSWEAMEFAYRANLNYSAIATENSAIGVAGGAGIVAVRQRRFLACCVRRESSSGLRQRSYVRSIAAPAPHAPLLPKLVKGSILGISESGISESASFLSSPPSLPVPVGDAPDHSVLPLDTSAYL